MTWQPGFVLLILLLLVFPDGRLPSRRWAPIIWIAGIALVVMVVPEAIAFWRYRGPLLIPFNVATPASDPAPAIAGLLQGVGLLLCLVVATASAAAVIVRFRRSAGAEHQQIKWFASAAAVEFAVIFVMSAPPPTVVPPPFDALLAIVVAPLIPIAIGIAILRYRLYDIDRIISRTVSYGAVTGILAVVFVGTVLVSQTVLASFFSGNSVAVAASTLVVAALFQPLRRRVQARRGSALQPLALRRRADGRGLRPPTSRSGRPQGSCHRPRKRRRPARSPPPASGSGSVGTRAPDERRVLRRVAYAVAALAIALTTAGFVCFVAITLHDGQFAIDANGYRRPRARFHLPDRGRDRGLATAAEPDRLDLPRHRAIAGAQLLRLDVLRVWPGRGAGLAADRRLHVMGRRLDMGAWLRPLRNHRPAHLSRRTPSVAAVASRERRGHRLHDPHDGADRGRQLAACEASPWSPWCRGRSAADRWISPSASRALALAFVGAAAVASLVSLVLRWRRSRGIERAQLKWLAFAVMIEIPVLFVFGVDVFKPRSASRSDRDDLAHRVPPPRQPNRLDAPRHGVRLCTDAVRRRLFGLWTRRRPRIVAPRRRHVLDIRS